MAGTKKDIFWRIAIAYFAVVLFGFAITYKVFKTQNIEGNYWRSLSDSLTTRVESVEAERGNIYTADGRLLATSLPVFEIRMDLMAQGLDKKSFFENVNKLSNELANLFNDKDARSYSNELINARNSKERYHLIKANVNYIDLLKLKKFTLFSLGQNKGGLIVKQKNKRIYPYQRMAKRTIGYVRDNNIQAVGLEGYFNNYLSGTNGKRLEQKVNGGNWIPLNDEDEVDPLNGKDIYTTIDLGLQDLAENALLKTLVKNKADHGCVIVMEVKTGKIKAIANLGIKDSTYQENFNYAIGEAHEPGSTFKLASMLCLLEDGFVDIDDSVDLERGQKRYYSQIMKDAEVHNLSKVSIKSCFAHSSNVGVSKLITEHYSGKPEKYISRLYSLGLNSKTNIEIPGESSPNIKNTSDKHWSRVSLPWMSVGYELNMTPLRLLTLYNAVANNGVMMKPYIVEAVKEYGQIVKEYKPVVTNQKICSEKTLSGLKEMLEAVIVEGTAKNLLNPHYSVAGKTGTAQIADSKYGYAKKVYQSSFIGYFPANNPIYSIAVVINNPTAGVYYGSAVAAPVFKEIADNVYASTFDMHPNANDSTKEYAQSIIKSGFKDDVQEIYSILNINHQIINDGAWVKSNIDAEKNIELESVNIDATSLIPNVTGMGLRDALYLLENKGLQVICQGYGNVANQSLKAGTVYTKGQKIYLTLKI